MSDRSHDLRTRFCRALGALGAMANTGALFDELVARYQEPHRHYHTMAHIDSCLAWLDWFSASAEHPEEVELALWFHDAVYDPRGNDNERKSAELAGERLREVGVSPASVDRIIGYIEATESHPVGHGDRALVIDIDLAILGASPQEFECFEKQIRKEYTHVPETEYWEGRRRVLSGFLARPEIYNLPEILALLEAKARANLEQRVRKLS